MPDPKVIMIVVVAGVAIVFALLAFMAMMMLFKPWLQGFLSGAPIPIFALIGMRLRRIDVSAVMRSLILAKQSGVELSHLDLQRAYLRGVDLEKITLAHIAAHKRRLGTSFEELVELELSDRLKDRLEV